MHIQKVIATNLNNASFTHPVSRRQIFTGENGAGKSTVLHALTLAIKGYHPDVAQSNAAVMENFASDASLAVAIETAKGTFSRKWTRKGAKVSKSEEGDETIVAGMMASMFAGHEFVNSNVKERAFMLRAAFPSAGDPIQAVIDAVAELPEFVAVPDGARDNDFDVFVESWVLHVTEKRKEAKQNNVRMKGVIQGLEQLAAEAKPLGDIVTDEALTEANAEASKATQAHGVATGLVNALPELPAYTTPGDKTLEEIEAEYAEVNEKITDLQGRIAEENGRRRQRQDQRATILGQWQKDVAALAKAQKAFNEAVAAGKECSVTVSAAPMFSAPPVSSAAVKEAAKPNGEEHNKWLRTIAEIEGELKNMPTAEDGHCKCCGASREHWKASTAEALENLQGRLTEAKGFKEAVDRLVEQSIATFRAAEEAEKRYAVATQIIATQQALEALADPGPEPTFEAVVNNTAPDEEVYQLECTRDDLLEESKRLRDNAIYEEGMKLVEQRMAAVESARIDMEQKQAKLAELALRAAAQNERKMQLEKQQQAVEELAKSEALEEVADATLKKIYEAASAEAKKAVQPILDVAARFTQGILKTPLAVDGLKFGRWHGTHWQPIGRLSGAEKAMVTAAISAALATFQPSKIVVVDEFAVFTNEWKELFMENLEAAQEAGMIEQVILFDHTPMLREGWDVTQV